MGILLLKTRRTGRTIKAKYYYRKNIISESHKVLLPREIINKNY